MLCGAPARRGGRPLTIGRDGITVFRHREHNAWPTSRAGSMSMSLSSVLAPAGRVRLCDIVGTAAWSMLVKLSPDCGLCGLCGLSSNARIVESLVSGRIHSARPRVRRLRSAPSALIPRLSSRIPRPPESVARLPFSRQIPRRRFQSCPSVCFRARPWPLFAVEARPVLLHVYVSQSDAGTSNLSPPSSLPP
ncbi:hypothetical protein VTN02DRAFT_5801 [Thermoascus thermophilus]